MCLAANKTLGGRLHSMMLSKLPGGNKVQGALDKWDASTNLFNPAYAKRFQVAQGAPAPSGRPPEQAALFRGALSHLKAGR